MGSYVWFYVNYKYFFVDYYVFRNQMIQILQVELSIHQICSGILQITVCTVRLLYSEEHLRDYDIERKRFFSDD